MISCLAHVVQWHHTNMITLLTLKDTSLLNSKSTLFPTRATKTHGHGQTCRASPSTNFFASSNERLFVMSYTTIAACSGWSKRLVNWGRVEVDNNIPNVKRGHRRTVLTWWCTKRTNEHRLNLDRWTIKKIIWLLPCPLLNVFYLSKDESDRENPSYVSTARRIRHLGTILSLNRGKKKERIKELELKL